MKRELERFSNREIILPNDFRAMINGRDTLIGNDYFSKINLVIWYDSIGCSTCQVGRMNLWNDIVNYMIPLRDKVNLLFLFSPKKKELHDLYISFRTYPFNCPVFIDTAEMFSTLNPHIPADQRLHSFLLDKDNKVVLVGNPLGNEPLWALYKEQIRELINAGV